MSADRRQWGELRHLVICAIGSSRSDGGLTTSEIVKRIPNKTRAVSAKAVQQTLARLVADGEIQPGEPQGGTRRYTLVERVEDAERQLERLHERFPRVLEDAWLRVQEARGNRREQEWEKRRREERERHMRRLGTGRRDE